MCNRIPDLPDADPRVGRRYHQVVVSHVPPADRVAAGLRVPPGAARPFAAAQGAWRFLNNEAVTLPRLAGPLAECARAGVADACDAYALVVLDWSPLHYGGHESKERRVELAHSRDLGYDLLTALAVSDRDGSPLAPVSLDLRAADGVHTTRADRVVRAPSQLDGLGPVMAHAAGLLAPTGRVPAFLIDREADSVGHYRRWDADRRKLVVRADDNRLVLHAGGEVKRPAVVKGCGGPGRSPTSGRSCRAASRPASSWPRRRSCSTARRGSTGWTARPAGRRTATCPARGWPCGWSSARSGTRTPGPCWPGGCC